MWMTIDRSNRDRPFICGEKVSNRRVTLSVSGQGVGPTPRNTNPLEGTMSLYKTDHIRRLDGNLILAARRPSRPWAAWSTRPGSCSAGAIVPWWKPSTLGSPSRHI